MPRRSPRRRGSVLRRPVRAAQAALAEISLVPSAPLARCTTRPGSGRRAPDLHLALEQEVGLLERVVVQAHEAAGLELVHAHGREVGAHRLGDDLLAVEAGAAGAVESGQRQEQRLGAVAHETVQRAGEVGRRRGRRDGAPLQDDGVRGPVAQGWRLHPEPPDDRAARVAPAVRSAELEHAGFAGPELVGLAVEADDRGPLEDDERLLVRVEVNRQLGANGELVQRPPDVRGARVPPKELAYRVAGAASPEHRGDRWLHRSGVAVEAEHERSFRVARFSAEDRALLHARSSAECQSTAPPPLSTRRPPDAPYHARQHGRSRA